MISGFRASKIDLSNSNSLLNLISSVAFNILSYISFETVLIDVVAKTSKIFFEVLKIIPIYLLTELA